MLTAIAHGKAGRIQMNGHEELVSWREVFRASEDLLTAVVFSRLRYLSPAGLQKVMNEFVGEDSAHSLGWLERIDFWPRLKRLDGRAWVEPDVLLRFSDAVVLVEVKPPFGGQQSLRQWQTEVQALVADYSKDDEPAPAVVHFIGFGRNTFEISDTLYAEFDTDGVFDLVLHTQEWAEFARAVPNWRSESTGSDLAVFEDWLTALTMFGIQSFEFTWPAMLTWASHHTLTLNELVNWPIRSDPKGPPAAPELKIDWTDLLVYTQHNGLT
jgi:hypothetical protein